MTNNELYSYLNDYIKVLYDRQNRGVKLDQKYLFGLQEYYDLLKPVVDCVINHKDYSLNELRSIIYKQSGLEEKVRNFIYTREMAPGLVFSYGTKNYQETIVIGNRQEVTLDDNNNIVPAVEQMTEDTIFDLASITKLFTSLSMLKLIQNGTISLDDEITKYAPEFINLKGVTIFDLITFKVPLLTNGRVDRAADNEEAEKILFSIYVDTTSKNLSPYTDMGAMVLKYVIEHATGMRFYDFVDENILKPLKMNDTHVVVPKMKLDRVASTNLDFKYYKDGNIGITREAPKGVVYDAKARIMGQPNGIASGHASIFSTEHDMTNLAKAIIGGQVIDKKYVEMMAKNRTGRKYFDNDQEKYVQYLGFLCYSKNPVLSSSEVFHALSGKTLASAGWTGTQLTVDPINKLYFFMAGNRSHNRMTFIDPVQREKVMTDENGKKTIVLPNGNIKVDATRFAWERDTEVVHPSIKLAIQYKMLEDIYNKFIDTKIEQARNVRSI